MVYWSWKLCGTCVTSQSYLSPGYWPRRQEEMVWIYLLSWSHQVSVELLAIHDSSLCSLSHSGWAMLASPMVDWAILKSKLANFSSRMIPTNNPTIQSWLKTQAKSQTGHTSLKCKFLYLKNLWSHLPIHRCLVTCRFGKLFHGHYYDQSHHHYHMGTPKYFKLE